ncbi:MAG: ABC transporter ATP-binding protein [Candidatus Krumholzibacteriota bacterium]|nr:ABC transporter ATP-binding protein [Candidatus Krumholzibacteriota bacterium]
MMNTGQPILSIEKLHKDFRDTKALKGIDVSLDKAGVYGFLGPNGAGKTTTFKIVSGLLAPTSGSVRICGVDVVHDTRDAMRHLGVLFDSPAYYPYLSGEENLEVFARWSGRKGKRKISDLLSMVGLGKSMKRKVEGYSWGMKRRLGIAAALLDDPDLLLLDEPTNGLDPSGIAEVRELIPGLAYENGCTVMLSSHRMEEVDQICESITIIHDGKIVASGSVEGLSRAEPFVEIMCDDTDAAKELLRRSSDVDVVEDAGPGRIRIYSARIGASAINRILLGNGIEVRQFAEKRESLEEIFFRLTGESDND